MDDDKTITHVAINYRNTGRIFSLPKPYRHHDLIQVIASLGEPTPVNGTQGFLLGSGEFVMRKAAARIAVSSGQCRELQAPPSLFSEDLW